MEQIFYYTGVVVCIILLLGVGGIIGLILYLFYLELMNRKYWGLHRTINKIYKKLSDKQKIEINKELWALIRKYKERCKN